jgi:HPt (histidine-containing phosphotransfer) domain-containing protein
VLDRKRLRDLTDGDAEFERELIDTYKDSARNILIQLRANLSAGNALGVAREAHALKGASLNVGASSMARCAAEIETAARAGDARRASEKLDDLRGEEQALWAELEQL